METHFLEATNGEANWGKFMIARFSAEERLTPSALPEVGGELIRSQGWTPKHLLILDLQTGEAALFLVSPNGVAGADLAKHKIWVCPLFEPMLEWLYQQDVSDLSALPSLIGLDVPFSVSSYRRSGLGESYSESAYQS